MTSKLIWILIEILSIYCVDSRNPYENPICPTDRIDAITSLSNNSLIAIKGSHIWIFKNGKIEKFASIWDQLPQMDQLFRNNLNGLVFDEKEGVSLIFKDKYFSVSLHSPSEQRETPKEIDTYFEGVVKIDASMLVIDRREWCWQQFRCQILHLFAGHFLWSFNWFHFWHIESRMEKPIDMKSINHNFPDSLDAAFAQNNLIYLIKDNFFFQVPIERFPLKVSDEDLKRLSLFDRIIRCEFITHFNRRQSSDDLSAISSEKKEIFLNISVFNQSLDNSSMDQTLETINSNTTFIETDSTTIEDLFQPFFNSTLTSNSSFETTTVFNQKTLEEDIEEMNGLSISSQSKTSVINNNILKLNNSETNTTLPTTTISQQSTIFMPSMKSSMNSSEDNVINNSNTSETLTSQETTASHLDMSYKMETFTIKPTLVFNRSLDNSSMDQTLETINLNTTVIETNSTINEDLFESFFNSSFDKPEQKHRMMSITTVWIIAIVLIFTAIIGIFLWKKTTNRRGYYNLDDKNE